MGWLVSKSAFGAGVMTWSLAEYCIHRFVGHGPKRVRGGSWRELLSPGGIAAEFNREHVAHHVDPTYFAPTWRKALAAAAVGFTSGVAATALLGPRRGISYAAGLLSMYTSYEWVHRRIHTHAPAGPYGRWVRMNHWHHHRTPRSNHGVTSPLWDRVFGTSEPVERVRLPRGVAPPWLVDDQGELRADFCEDYELVGAPREGAKRAERRA
ncbi:MAG: sterol desaturase family protein [Polyangiaceae bacterium]|jgi:hypothetical protein|nr:sterol desaturase family protein [Polyangiaceae bacterium]